MDDSGAHGRGGHRRAALIDHQRVDRRDLAERDDAVRMTSSHIEVHGADHGGRAAGHDAVDAQIQRTDAHGLKRADLLEAEVCDEILVMDYGRTLAEGSPREIQQNQAVIDAYLGEEPLA